MNSTVTTTTNPQATSVSGVEDAEYLKAGALPALGPLSDLMLPSEQRSAIREDDTQVTGAGVLGCDSSDLATRANLLSLATNFLHTTPVFWGRYFKTAGNTDSVQYQAHTEADFFRQNNLKLLPFARQTRHVNGSFKLGSDDAVGNVEAYLNSVPLERLLTQGGTGTPDAKGREFLFFLDVEGVDNQPSLSVPYYIGWARKVMQHSQTLTDGQLTLLPAVYMNFSDETTAESLTAADEAGDQQAKCYGVMTAHYRTDSVIPVWNSDKAGPRFAIPCATLMWQFRGDFHATLDFTQINSDPAHSQWTLDRLAVP